MKYLKIYEEKKEEPIRKECLFCYVYITFTFKKYNNTYNENNKDIINILYIVLDLVIIKLEQNMD